MTANPLEALLEQTLAEHRHPGELLTVFGEAWVVCSCGERIDLPVVDAHVSIPEAAALFEAHQAQALAAALGATVEWGVRHSQGVRTESSERSARQWQVNALQRFESNFRDKVRPTVARRFVTDWIPAEEVEGR